MSNETAACPMPDDVCADCGYRCGERAAEVAGNPDGMIADLIDNEANARLVAAAPVMLEALEGLRRRVRDHFGGPSGWREEDAAADAISAATVS